MRERRKGRLEKEMPKRGTIKKGEGGRHCPKRWEGGGEKEDERGDIARGGGREEGRHCSCT